MAKVRRTVTGTLIFFILICAGFAAGFYASRIVPRDSLTAIGEDQGETPPINERVYRISPPSIGNGLVTRDVPNLIFKDGVYFEKISKQEAESAGLQNGQQVLLYGKDGKLLDAMGELISLGKNFNDNDKQITLVIGFKRPGITAEFMVNRGEIITGRNSDMLRLPKTAIVSDNGTLKVWEVRYDRSGKHTARLSPIRIVKEEKDYIVIGTMPKSSNLFILNPDKHLREGQTVNTEKILYAGPGVTVDYEVNKRIDAITRGYARLALTNREQQRKLASLGTKSSSCGIPPDTSQRFIDKIKMQSSGPVFNPPNMSLPGSRPQ